MDVKLSVLVCSSLFLVAVLAGKKGDDGEEDVYTTSDPSKREPSPCEVCKFFVTELQSRLDETGKSKEVLETGHGLELKKKRFKYNTAELRLIEALNDPHVCERILEYNVHAERKGSLRYAKGQSETMGTLHGLVNKGVKVDLGIPYELWDKPSAEVSKMQRACFKLAEDYEEDIEDWYFHKQEKVSIADYICRERYLKGKDQQCMGEVFVPGKDNENKDESEPEEKKVKKKKGKKKKKKKNKELKGDTGTTGSQEEKKSDVKDQEEKKSDVKDEL